MLSAFGSRLSVLAMVLLPALARAQTVRGTVVERVDSAPVSGVVVLLMDAAGNVAARALTNERGEYRLSAATAGTYRVRTLRIGFRPVTSDPLLLTGGEEVSRQLAVAGVPFSLDTVRVQRRSTCRLRVDSALVTYAIWEQVRTALTATDLSSRARNMGAVIVTYDRDLDPKSRRVRRQASYVHTGITTKPWVSPSPDSLRRAGYVAEVNNWYVYTAPDLDVLLSAEFLEDHCFRVADVSDSSRLGLAFEPTRERSGIPEIRGVIWLDRRSAELRRMEFQYTNIAREQEAGDAGGEMDFVRTKNGVWAISSWNIRMPLLTQSPYRSGNAGDVNRSNGSRFQVTELKIGGGELALLTRGSDTLWSRPPLTLTGSIVDSASDRPVAGARVALRGTNLESVADSSGRFSLSGVLPGEYTVQVRTTALDSLAVVWQSDLNFADAAKQVALRLPSLAFLMGRLCPDTAREPAGLVVGQVGIRGDSLPKRNVHVVADWEESAVKSTGPGVMIGKSRRWLETRTDATGTFRICGVPVNRAFLVRSALNDSVPMAGRIPPSTRIVRVDIVVDTTARVAARLNDATLIGKVVSASSRQPISGAEVSLSDVGSVKSDSLGVFRIAGIPTGPHQVTVRQIGFLPLDIRIDFEESATLARQFVLSATQVLDSIVVAARRAGIPEFEERRRIGIGNFIAREDLAKQENRRMSEVLVRIGGLQVRRATGGSQAWITSSSRGQTTGYQPDEYSAGMGAKRACYVDVWLDGVRVYAGGQEMLWDVNSVGPASVEAVEYYAGPAQTPAKYTRVNQECGTLVLWTRRGP